LNIAKEAELVQNQENKSFPLIAKSYKPTSYKNEFPSNNQKKEEQIMFEFDKEGQAKREILWLHMGLDDNSVNFQINYCKEK